MPPPDTKERILDAAELLFSRHGIGGTSLRTLTESAGVNLAAVNYHFQSKDALVQAVLYRRIHPINQRRMELLDAVLQSGSPPRIEAILDAFYRPPVEAAIGSRNEGRSIVMLLGRIYTEPGDLLMSQVRSMMADVAARFTEAFQASLPDLSPEVAQWRLHFCVGVLTHLFGAMPMIEGLARGRLRLDDSEEIIRQMVAYAAGGLRA